jgi:hypothetical protein
MRSLPARLIASGSLKGRFACGKLKSSSACEAAIGDVAGCDTEQEQEMPDRDWPAPEKFPSWDPVRAPFAIMGHIPPCMQQPQVHADWHAAWVPVRSNDVCAKLHRPRISTSVHKNPLITIETV